MIILDEESVDLSSGRQNSLEAYYSRDRNPMRRYIYKLILESDDGLTVDECRIVGGDTEFASSSYSARVSELRKAGVIAPHGRRLTRSGCWADVNYAIEKLPNLNVGP